jgi:hypothetical protein
VTRALLAAVMLVGATAHAAPIASVVGPAGDADVRTSILIGPSGQVYQGDGGGTWTRTLAGGVAADVSGSARIGKDVIVTGVSTPLYRFDGTGWTAVRLGQSGKTVMGRGPVPAVAVGRHVFVHNNGKWVRVAAAPGAVTALWASSTKKVFAVTADGVHALRGSDLVRTRAAVGAIVGASPWGISDTGAIDASNGKSVLAATGAIAATGGAGTPWLVTSDGANPLQLVGKVGGKATTIETPIPAGTGLAGLAADKSGRVVIVTAAGEAHIWADSAWSTGALVDQLPEAKSGPGPANTR